MQWYWWVLIGIGVVLASFVKISVWNRMIEKRKNKAAPKNDEED